MRISMTTSLFKDYNELEIQTSAGEVEANR